MSSSRVGGFGIGVKPSNPRSPTSCSGWRDPDWRANPPKIMFGKKRLADEGLADDFASWTAGRPTVIAVAMTSQEPRAGFPLTLESRAEGLKSLPGHPRRPAAASDAASGCSARLARHVEPIEKAHSSLVLPNDPASAAAAQNWIGR